MPKQKKQIIDLVAKRRAARKVAKAKTARRTLAQSTAPSGVIDPEKSYTRTALAKDFGLGFIWFREACKQGLKTHKAGRVKFVRGVDLQQFIESDKGRRVTGPKSEA